MQVDLKTSVIKESYEALPKLADFHNIYPFVSDC